MIEIGFNNKEKVTNDFDVHDALVANFEYKHDERVIYLNLDNSEWGYDIKLRFENVLYFEVQSCYFWGKGYNILEWELVEEEEEILTSLCKKADHIKNSSFNLLLKENTYFATKFLMNSGDEILIYCEKIFVEEKRK